MGWEAVGAHQLTAAPHEEVGDLDDVALDAPRHRRDLAHRAPAVALEGGVDHQVDRRRDGRDDEPCGDVLAREERQRAHLGDGLAGTVGMDGAHAGQAGVEGDEQVEALGLTHLSDHDARRPHP